MKITLRPFQATHLHPPTATAPRAPEAETSTAPTDGYQSSQDALWVKAGDLMSRAGVELINHNHMRENIATYLAHSTRTIPSVRWENKLQRELNSPYTDAQVYQHLESLEDSVQENLRELPALPSKVYITGSFAKGRLGANSDLDGFAVVKPEHMSVGFDSYERRESNSTASNLFPLSQEAPGYVRGHLMFSGQSVEFSPEELLADGTLRRVYDKIREERSEDRIETSQGFEWITDKLWGENKSAKEKREAFESNSLKTRLQNGVMSLGGTLSQTPLIGTAVNAITDLFVAQKHLDGGSF